MPYARCPKCSRIQHLSINIPLEEWLRERSPNTRPGEMPEMLCFACWSGAAQLPDRYSAPGN